MITFSGTCKCIGNFYGSDCGQEALLLSRDPDNLKYWRGTANSKPLVWDQHIVEVTAEHVQDGWGLEVLMDVSAGSKGYSILCFFFFLFLPFSLVPCSSAVQQVTRMCT